MQESNRRIIRNDIIVILVALVTALVFLCFNLIPALNTDGERALIYLENEMIGEYSLSEDISLPIYNKSGDFLLNFNIKEREVYVTDSLCNDHSCERMGPISRSGESIICLISKLVIKIEGADKQVDAVAFISYAEVKKLR